MKSILSLIVLIMITGFPVTGIIPSDSLDQDRDIFELLEQNQEQLKQSIDGLSQEQMNYKPDAESWSIAQVVEHINTVEAGLSGMLRQKFTEDATPEMRSEVQMSDEQVLGLITDRSQKMKTQAQFEPKGAFSTADDALEAFEDQREDIVDFLKDTDVDMRNYINEFPFGKIDAYQTVLFMAGHTSRHIEQIREIKQTAGF
ncbi:MAG: DinB family protein, partial [Salegentibacter mishustinae]|nr:DinB family protein [Salegentibacter mishustinae]